MSESQEWLYLDPSGNQLGPVTADQLQQLAVSAQINPDTQVWTQGLDDWIPANQVEGLLPPAPATPPPLHQPQINLGPQTTPPPAQQEAPVHQPQINLGPSRALGTTPMASAPVNPYAVQKKSSPVKWIVLGIVGLLVLGIVIIIAVAPSEDELAATIPGYKELKEANKNLDGSDSAHGNTTQASKIAANAKKLLAEVREEGIEKGITGSGKFSAFCLITEADESTTVVIIFRVPKIRKFADDAKKFISEYAWVTSKLAVMNNMDETKNVKLAVALRGVIFYDTMYVGEPLITGDPSENPLEGVKETFKEQDCEEALYPYFAPQKTK